MSLWLRTVPWAGFIAVALCLALAPHAQAAPRAQAAALDIGGQPVVAGAITVASVTATQDGFVAAFRDNAGSPGDLLGATPVKKGTNAGVRIVIKGDLPNGTKVWVRLHIDAGTLGTLEFPGADVPARGADGSAVQKQLVIQPAAAPAAATQTPAAGAASPATLPNTGAGNDGPPTLLALALLASGALLALRRRSQG